MRIEDEEAGNDGGCKKHGRHAIGTGCSHPVRQRARDLAQLELAAEIWEPRIDVGVELAHGLPGKQGIDYSYKDQALPGRLGSEPAEFVAVVCHSYLVVTSINHDPVAFT